MPFELPNQAHNPSANDILKNLSTAYIASEQEVIAQLQNALNLSVQQKSSIRSSTVSLVSQCREEAGQGALFDQFLQEYGLSTQEGVTLMRLAEALIRTPDSDNATALIRDKLLAGDWKQHAFASPSLAVNGATIGLRLSASWIRLTGGPQASSLLARLGDQVLLFAVKRAMGIMSGHFVLGRTIDHAIANSNAYEKSGSTFSYDMLGEGAHTQADADHYLEAYLTAANAILKKSSSYSCLKDAPGISVKLSALHPRYEYNKRDSCVPALVQSILKIARLAKEGNFGLTIDAEEAERLEISLEIVEELLRIPELSGWDGLTIVVQAYQKRAPFTIAWLAQTARDLDRKIAVRLVKGAYWDMEIKRAQVLGLKDYPVYTRKENTDLAYLACVKALFSASDVIFPQFATHNAQTAAAVIELAGNNKNYEFQRLHGMGPQLHKNLMEVSGVKSRIYAPVGKYKDLLPYLVRRLLENGANSSFVNKMLDPDVPVETLAIDPTDQVNMNVSAEHPKIPAPRNILDGKRLIAKGWDYTQRSTSHELENAVNKPVARQASSLVDGRDVVGQVVKIMSPQDTSKLVSTVQFGNEKSIIQAIDACNQSGWKYATSQQKQTVLLRAADLLEEDANTFFALCVQEAGKSIADAVAEVREAVDFCRYYADQLTTPHMSNRLPHGNIACISPWNFPLAIFLGQVVAALAAGNNVIAKPAEQTPVIAYRAVQLLHRAGIPHNALHLVLGGADIGTALVSSIDIHGICFTGSTHTAKKIASTLAETNRPILPLIAETGGLNAMIIDSTALIEQAVADVVASAFQSAGQRCSACRIVCIQDSIADDFIKMLSGAMDLLDLGDPAHASTDVGPVIDHTAQNMLNSYIADGRKKWSVIGETPHHSDANLGHFVAPIAFEIASINELSEEKFGPVLHVLRFKAKGLEKMVQDINALGYGLTMGQHTRIDSRVSDLIRNAQVGNLYINRNQIGAVVGVQPFGGEGLSGTGPKAGGPLYLRRLSRSHSNETKVPVNLSADWGRMETPAISHNLQALTSNAIACMREWSIAKAQGLLLRCSTLFSKGIDVQTSVFLADKILLPSPTGEINELSYYPRGIIVCCADDFKTLEKQILKCLSTGNGVFVFTNFTEEKSITYLQDQLVKNGLPKEFFNLLPLSLLHTTISLDIDGAVIDGEYRDAVAKYLCTKGGPILPCLSVDDDIDRFVTERTVTINTTAAGGNASLLAM